MRRHMEKGGPQATLPRAEFSALGVADHRHLGAADRSARLVVAEELGAVAERPAQGPAGFLPAPLSGLRRHARRRAAAVGAEAAPVVRAAAAASAAAEPAGAAAAASRGHEAAGWNAARAIL